MRSQILAVQKMQDYIEARLTENRTGGRSYVLELCLVMNIVYRNTKGAGKKPAPKVLDLYRNRGRIEKSSVHN